MRDLVSCFSENSVNVVSHSSSSCSSYSSSNNKSCIISPPPQQSLQNAVVSLYRVAQISSQIHHVIKLTWFKNHHSSSSGAGGHGVALTSGECGSIRLSINSRLFKKKKGNKTLEIQNLKIEVVWDLSAAKYDCGSPEPIDSFYVLVMVDSRVWLTLGNLADNVKKSKVIGAKFRLISRQEHFTGTNCTTTKARFVENGILHEISIKCSGENHELSVWIDKKIAIRVKKLEWNFRGNQSIFVDGLIVDLMWDVHDWFFFNSSSKSNSNGVFMFRTRSEIDNSSRLWLDEKILQDKLDFSLLIYACKNP
jgi:hypothetical protein